MNFDQISFHFEHSSTIKLLRSDYATLALSFFIYAFKKTNRSQIPFNELKLMLKSYLESFNEQVAHKNEQYHAPADHYLNLWCSENHRFIRKFYDYESDIPLVELTYDSERAIEWMENLNKKEFVGTHSRFSLIFENLQTIASEVDQGPATRLKYLKDKKKEVSEEIKEIEETGTFKRMDSTQVRERFLNLIEDGRRLIADFSLVEEIFKDLTLKIKEQKLKESLNRGDLLGQILDAYDYLEESDQGKSFNSFWNFLMSSSRQQELNELINKTVHSMIIEQFVEQTKNQHYVQFLKKFKANLLQAGQKVLKSKYRLTEEIRKLLHQQFFSENKQIVEDIFDIKKCLIENKDLFLKRPLKDFIEIDFLPSVNLPLERPLWSPKLVTEFADDFKPQLQDESAEVEDELFKHELGQSFYIDYNELLRRIKKAVQESRSGQISLKEITDLYPIEKGLAELIGYVDLAITQLESSLSMISEREQEEILFDPLGREINLEGEKERIPPFKQKAKMPKVIFSKLSGSASASASEK